MSSWKTDAPAEVEARLAEIVATGKVIDASPCPTTNRTLGRLPLSTSAS